MSSDPIPHFLKIHMAEQMMKQITEQPVEHTAGHNITSLNHENTTNNLCDIEKTHRLVNLKDQEKKINDEIVTLKEYIHQATIYHHDPWNWNGKSPIKNIEQNINESARQIKELNIEKSKMNKMKADIEKNIINLQISEIDQTIGEKLQDI